jgi:DNA replication protein DnaC
MSDDHINKTLERLEKHVTDEPVERAPLTAPPEGDNLFRDTGFAKRYRPEWDRPTDEEWMNRFSWATEQVRKGGIVALVGRRGSGKTQMAAELVRDRQRAKGRYVTAMKLFLRLRASFGKGAAESEMEIVAEMSACPILVIDEVQERGGSEWEDRILTHIIDNRYGDQKPTVLIANLTTAEMQTQLGPSICDRIKDAGGMMEFENPSWRGWAS